MSEFDKLCKMLDEAKIPYERCDDDDPCNNPESKFFKKRLWYGKPSNMTRTPFTCSVIYGYGSYGYDNGLLEIMGLLTPEELEYDSVCGYLTAEDVFQRIDKHYKEERKLTMVNTNVENEVAQLIWDICTISPEHGNAVLDILGDEVYERVMRLANNKEE